MSTEVAVKQSIVSIDDWLTAKKYSWEIRTVYFRLSRTQPGKIECNVCCYRGSKSDFEASGIATTSCEAFVIACAKVERMILIEDENV